MVSIVELNKISDEKVGGKARGLNLLIKSGLAVPRGFVITDTGSDKFPRDLRKYHESLKAESVAVRSSAMKEDGAELSAAGQYETFLGIDSHDNLVKAIDDCIGSAKNKRVSAYNKTLGQDNNEENVAVIIQEMVDAVTAGVLFTADPVSLSRGHLVIEAARGLGVNVVDGKTGTVQYKVDRNTGEIKGNGSPENILNHNQIHELYKGALKVEKLYDMPVDIEWAVDGQGKVWWLQARPITTLDKYSLDTVVTNDGWIESTGNVGEVFPGSITPLTYSTAGLSLNIGMFTMFSRCGVFKKSDKNVRFIHYFDNHLFFHINSMWIISNHVLGSTYDQIEYSICGKSIEDRGDTGRRGAFLKRLVNFFKYMRIIFNDKKYMGELQKLSETFNIETENLTTGELYSTLMENQDVLDHAYFLHYCMSAHSAVMNIILKRSNRNAGDEVISTLLADISDIESAQIPIELDKLADMIIEDGGADKFLDLPDTRRIDWLNSKNSEKSGGLWRDFIKNHGHRCIRELEMMEIEWESDPRYIINTLTGYVELKKKKNSQLRKRGRGFPGETKDSKLVKMAKDGVRKREKSKSMLVRVQNQFKKAYRELGRCMVNDGILEGEEQIYFFTKEEIGEVINNPGPENIKKADFRKKKYNENMELHFPMVCRGRPLPVSSIEVDENVKVLKGMPVSRGVVEGTVRIVRNREDAEKLVQGDIMVSTFTDIGWSPYYSRLGGLITELGSPLSHGAVVAREYGIPLVSGVTDAIRILGNGSSVRVNGTAGIIEILKDAK
ncbi:PEP/pyruvate-binding domain-containing protein [Spirochaetota bacterium]